MNIYIAQDRVGCRLTENMAPLGKLRLKDFTQHVVFLLNGKDLFCLNLYREGDFGGMFGA